MSDEVHEDSRKISFSIKLFLVAVALMFVGGLGVLLAENYYLFEKIRYQSLSRTLQILLRTISIVIFIVGAVSFLVWLFRTILRLGSSSIELEGISSVTSLVSGTLPFIGNFMAGPIEGSFDLAKVLVDDKNRRVQIQEAFMLKVEKSSRDATKMLLISWERLNIEERRLAARSLLTLASGVLLTVVAISLLVYFTVTFDSQIKELETDGNHLTFLLPRITGVLIIQVLAGFFLKMYVASENAISINKAELTNIEMRIASLGLAASDENKFELAKFFAVEERLGHLGKNVNIKTSELEQSLLKSLIGKIGPTK